MPGKGTHTAKWDSCFKKVQAGGKSADAAAICTAALGGGSFNKESVQLFYTDLPKGSNAREELRESHSFLTVDLKTFDVKTEVIQERDFSDAERKKLADAGHAMPDGSYPIENTGDLENAVKAWHRGQSDASAAKVKAHIKKRARALGATDSLPDDWKEAFSDLSYDRQMDRLDEDFDNQFGDWDNDGDDGSDSILDYFDGYVIVADEDDLYKVNYTDQNGECVFDPLDQWQPVEITYTPVSGGPPTAEPAEPIAPYTADTVDTAYQGQGGPGGEMEGYRLTDIYPNYVLALKENKQYRIPYTVDGDKVTFAQITEADAPQTVSYTGEDVKKGFVIEGYRLTDIFPGYVITRKKGTKEAYRFNFEQKNGNIIFNTEAIPQQITINKVREVKKTPTEPFEAKDNHTHSYAIGDPSTGVTDGHRHDVTDGSVQPNEDGHFHNANDLFMAHMHKTVMAPNNLADNTNDSQDGNEPVPPEKPTPGKVDGGSPAVTANQEGSKSKNKSEDGSGIGEKSSGKTQESLRESDKVRTLYLSEALDFGGASVDRKNGLIDVTIIKPGWSKMGKYYSPKVLESKVGIWDGVKAFGNHPSKTEEKDLPERSIWDQVGYYTSPRFEDGVVRGHLQLVGDEAKKNHILDWAEESIRTGKPFIGLSINALGKTKLGEAEGRRGIIVEDLVEGNSIDVVTQASAGGSFDRLLASDDGFTNKLLKNLEYTEWREARPEYFKRLQDEMRTARKEELEQAAIRESAQLKSEVARKDEELKQATERANRTGSDLEELKTQFETFKKETLVDQKLRESKLPDEWVVNLRESLLNSGTPEDMDKLVETERKKFFSIKDPVKVTHMTEGTVKSENDETRAQVMEALRMGGEPTPGPWERPEEYKARRDEWLASRKRSEG